MVNLPNIEFEAFKLESAIVNKYGEVTINKMPYDIYEGCDYQMKKISFNGHWKLISMDPQEGLLENIIKPCLEEGNWMNVNVPGDVYDTLLKYDSIPDPLYDTQARECYWVSSKEWWYVLRFDTSILSKPSIVKILRISDKV
jgi:hypothetical protein